LPPAAPAPDSGCSEPILYGLAAPNAARQGSGTSIMAPIAPAPQPTNRRRVSLPRYQMFSAHLSCFHFSVIRMFLPLGIQSLNPLAGFRRAIGDFSKRDLGGSFNRIRQAAGAAVRSHCRGNKSSGSHSFLG